MQRFLAWMCILMGMLLLGLAITARQRAMLGRIRALDGAGLRGDALKRSFLERNVKPAIALLSQMGGRLTPQGQQARMQDKLARAGLQGQAPLQILLAVKVLTLLFGIACFWLLLSLGIKPNLCVVPCALLWVLGMIAPEKWLDHQIMLRNKAIARALPEVLDLMTGCVECGLSFDSAIQRITERPSSSGRELREELSRYLNDIRLGHPRSEALMALERRCDLYEMKGIIAALLQADQLGVGVASILRSQSHFLRNHRRQKAQESAMKIPIKMLFPLVFCIFPVTFLVILGPALLRLMATLPKMLGG